MKKNQVVLLILIMVVMLCLSGCTAGPNPMVGRPLYNGTTAGFWLGLWHGMICPVTFVVSLFSDNVHIYEVFNNGGWYNFGFILGAVVLFGGGSSVTKNS